MLLRVSRLADGLPEVAEHDLNPVIARPDRGNAIDTKIRLPARNPCSGMPPAVPLTTNVPSSLGMRPLLLPERSRNTPCRTAGRGQEDDDHRAKNWAHCCRRRRLTVIQISPGLGAAAS